MDLIGRLGEIAGQLANVFFSFGADFNLPSLFVAFCLATGFLAWRQHRRRGRVSLAAIRRAVFEKRFRFDRAVQADIGFFFLNSLALGALIGWALVGADATATATASGLTMVCETRPPIGWPAFPTHFGATLASSSLMNSAIGSIII